MKYSSFSDPNVDTSTLDYTKGDLLDEVDEYVYGFFGLSIASLILNFASKSCFNYIGENFTCTIRSVYFRRILFKDMSYYDKKGNEPGNLSEKLSKDCSIINLIVGNYLGVIIESMCSFIVGIIIAFIASWRLALVTLALSPLLIFSGFMETKMMSSDKEEED